MHVETGRKIDGLLPALVVFGAAFLVSGLLLRYAVTPSWKALRAKAQRLEHVQMRITHESGHDALLKQIQDKRDALDQKLDALTHGMGDVGDLSGLLQTVFDMAYEAGVKFDRTEPQEESREGALIRYPILFETTTNYASLGTFVSSLERLPQAFRIDRIAMTAQRNGDIEALLLVTCFLEDRESEK